MILLEAAKRLNIQVPQAVIDYVTERLPVWKDIYAGNDVPWAAVTVNGVDRPRRRLLLKPASTLTRYISRLDTAEGSISVSPKRVQTTVLNVFERCDFWRNLRKLDERKEALGGAVLKPYISGGKVFVDFMLPDHFIPLKWDSNGITDAMFFYRCTEGLSYCTIVEVHRIIDAHLTVDTYLYRSKSSYDLGTATDLGKCKLTSGIQPHVVYNRDTPIYAYIYPAIADNITLESPLGVSRFADATDVLESVDVAFDEMQIERLMAEKMIFVSQFMLDGSVEVDGMPKIRFNKDTRIYQTLAIETAEKQMPDTFDPSFRVEEHRMDLQTQLDLLCFKTGLDVGTLSFDGQAGIKTATEIRSQNSKTYQVVAENQSILSTAIRQLVDAIIYLATQTGELPSGTQAKEIVCRFDDSITPDRDTYIKEGVLLNSNGLLSRKSFLTQYIGLSDDDAEAEIAKIKSEAVQTPGDLYGGL